MDQIDPPSHSRAPRTLWRITDTHDRVLDAVLVPSSARPAVAVRPDGVPRTVQEFDTTSAALAWAEEKRQDALRAAP